MDPSTPKAVLIVEDDRDIAEALSVALTSVGYSTMTASDGRAALDLLRQAREPVGLILLDLMMPVMDGWEFRARQRTDPTIRGIPVVILSAGGNVQAKAQNLQAAGFLCKPVMLDTLYGEVRAAMIKGGE